MASNRHLGRIIALQTLYEFDFRRSAGDTDVDLDEILIHNDVEADDKLIGPFSFRQFIYLIIVALAIAGAWGVAQIFVGLAIIFLPIILFFGVLALPLRKDQPMEIYMELQKLLENILWGF